jgi:hypothetical protein
MGSAGLFASKPAPTLDLCKDPEIASLVYTFVGASLLAMTAQAATLIRISKELCRCL